MKKLLFVFLFLLVCSFASPSYALIVTENVDKDAFQYEVGYKFATDDLAASLTAKEFSVESGSDVNDVFYYVVPREGRIVGMSVSSNNAVTLGAATFDVTINGLVTGVQTVIEPTAETVRSAVGTEGKADPQYAYIRQDRADTRVRQGFRAESNTAGIYDADHQYGKATALSAGNRVGVVVTTSSAFAATANDYIVVIYVLE